MARTYVIAGASSGFGRGMAVRLGAEGANVVVAARRADLLDEVAAEVRAAGGIALTVPTDVSDADAVERLSQAAADAFGCIDVWVNMAGIGAIGAFWDIPVADHARLVDINVKGILHGSHVAMRRFRAQGEGVLINVGSIESQTPAPYQSTYAASKAFVLSLGRSLNEEIRLVGPQAIKVVTVMPWAADTPWWQHAANYSGGQPRMPLPDDPETVVEALVRVSLHPQAELTVGAKARAAAAGHHLAPHLAERFAADVTQHYQIDTAPPAGPTSGALHHPVPEGRGVEGGLRDRMRREDAARR